VPDHEKTKGRHLCGARCRECEEPCWVARQPNGEDPTDCLERCVGCGQRTWALNDVIGIHGSPHHDRGSRDICCTRARPPGGDIPSSESQPQFGTVSGRVLPPVGHDRDPQSRQCREGCRRAFAAESGAERRVRSFGRGSTRLADQREEVSEAVYLRRRSPRDLCRRVLSIPKSEFAGGLDQFAANFIEYQRQGKFATLSVAGPLACSIQGMRCVSYELRQQVGDSTIVQLATLVEGRSDFHQIAATTTVGLLDTERPVLAGIVSSFSEGR